MNARKANWAFLIIVIFYILGSLSMLFLPENVTSNLLVTNLMLECILMLPFWSLSWCQRKSQGSFWVFIR